MGSNVKRFGRFGRAGRVGLGVAAAVAILAVTVIGAQLAVRPSTAAADGTDEPVTAPRPTSNASATRQTTAPGGPSLGPTLGASPSQQRSVLDASLGLIVPTIAVSSVSPDGDWIATPGLRVLVHRWRVGERYERAVQPIGTIRGDTFDEIAASIDRLVDISFPTGTFVRRDRQLDYRPAVEWAVRTRPVPANGSLIAIDLFVADGTAYLFTAIAQQGQSGTLTFIAYESIVGSADYLLPEVVTALGGRVAVTLNSNEHVAASTPAKLTIESDGTNLFGSIARGASIERYSLGSSITVDLPGYGDVTLAGHDLGALARSLTKVNPEVTAPAELTVDGRSALQWTFVVAQLEWFGPIRSSVTMVVDGNDLYVMTGSDALVRSVQFIE